MSRSLWTFLGAAVLAGCWESDGFIQVVPTPSPVHEDVTGPLGSRLSVDGRIDLAGLEEPVDIVRDAYGVVHIYARSDMDAFRAQGYIMARDRAVQVELLRRTALGHVAEVLGGVSPATIDQDIVMRTLGFRDVAERESGILFPVARAWVEAFADGVSQHFEEIRSGKAPMPIGGSEFHRSHFQPFTIIDVLAIDKLMQFALSWSIGQEVAATRFVAAGRAMVSSEKEALRRRAGMLVDVMRFAPPRPATTLGDLADDGADVPSWSVKNGNEQVLIPSGFELDLAPTLEAWNRAAGGVGSHGRVGSNVWAVSPVRSASGGSMLAADAHFRLTSPAALWLVHMQISGDGGESGPFVAGASIPGVPGVSYGFHGDLAWAPAASYFDVADLYFETVDASGQAVLFGNSFVPIEVRQETIAVASGPDVVFEVRVVPHHGPIVPVLKDHQVAPLDPAVGAVSVRWSGLEPTRDIEASLSMLFARGAANALAHVGAAPSSVRSHVFADRKDVMYVAPGLIIQRDARALSWDPQDASGKLPCLALPGDGSAEWVALRDPKLVPFVRNPSSGFVVTANADPVGVTLDNDPSNDVLSDGSSAFLACTFDAGFRQGRIQDRLMAAVEPLELEDAASIQADVRSELASRLVPHLLEAMDRAMRERDAPGTFPLLSGVAGSPRFLSSDSEGWVKLLRSWGSEVGYETSTGVTAADMSLSADNRASVASRATLMFHTWLIRVLDAVFADEMEALGLGLQGIGAISKGLPIRALLHLLERQPSALATFDPELQDSLLWDDLNTDALESRDERMVTAWLDALDWLQDHLGENRDRWRWGFLHTVRLSPVDPSMGSLSIPLDSDRTFPNGFPRPGGLFTVDNAPFEITPRTMTTAPNFSFSEGPALRFVVQFTADGPKAIVALAGGQVADPSKPHFRDGADYWRHNASHALMYRRDEVVMQARSREVAWSSEGTGSD